jgi:hypothetical protein
MTGENGSNTKKFEQKQEADNSVSRIYQAVGGVTQGW